MATKKAAEPVVTESIYLDPDTGDTVVKIDRSYDREDVKGLAKRLDRAAVAAN